MSGSSRILTNPEVSKKEVMKKSELVDIAALNNIKINLVQS